MDNLLNDATIYIQSKGRPENVGRYECLKDTPWTVNWVVEKQEVRAYRMYGAENIIIQDHFMQGRQLILDIGNASGQPYFQMSDDYKSVAFAEWSEKDQKHKAVKSTLPDAIRFMLRTLHDNPGIHHIGVAPTANILNYQGKPVSRNKFNVGCCVLFRPHDIHYPLDYTLKDDYGMSAMQILRYGANLRCDKVLINWQHWDNRGGCCDWRTPELQMKAAEALVRDFPQWIRHNTKKPGEVLFRWK
jgi:hypothetical protein